jgi:hypothetical protein
MSIYMLNLTFNPTDTTEANDARFVEYDSTQPLLSQSKIWLIATSVTPDPDNASDWQRLEQDTSLLTLNANDVVSVRFQALSSSLSGYTARLTTIVARNSKKASQNGNGQPFQKRASPFPLNTTQQSCVIKDSMQPFPGPSAAGSWVQQLGTVTFTTPPPNPKPPGFHDSYSVIVAITVFTSPTTALIYSHDPDMDVNC